MILLSLKCPRCADDLEGGNNSRVFFCRGCNLGVDLIHGREREYKLECVQPALSRNEEMEYFPFWKYAGRYQAIAEESRSPVQHETDFWVPAFFVKNISYYGDIGLYYTARKVNPSPERCRSIPIFPADRGEKNASAYPLIYARCLESATSFQVVEWTLSHQHLVLVPFFRVGGEYLDSQLGWAYPSGALI